MEYRKHLESISEFNDITTIVALLSLAAIPTAYSLSSASASTALLIMPVIAISISIALSWVNLKKSKTPQQYKSRLAMIIVTPLTALVLLVLAVSIDSLTTANIDRQEVKGRALVAAQRPIEQAPELLEVLQTIGAQGEYADLNLTLHSSDMSRPCELSNSLACYRHDTAGSHSIAISKQAYKHNIRLVLAHEFLHYSWQKHNLDKDTVLTSNLIDLYAKNTSLQELMSDHYVSSGSLNPDEIFSHACTNLSREELGGYIASKCSSFLDISKI